MSRLAALVVTVLLVSSCNAHSTQAGLGTSTSGADAVVGAVLMTGLAGGASAVRRANGECYTDCLPGTRCNRATGLCETLPCRGRCTQSQVCQDGAFGETCVEASELAVSAKKGERPVVPKDAKVAPATGTNASGVPAAATQPAPPKNDQPEKLPPAQGPFWTPANDPNRPTEHPDQSDPNRPPPR